MSDTPDFKSIARTILKKWPCIHCDEDILEEDIESALRQVHESALAAQIEWPSEEEIKHAARTLTQWGAEDVEWV
jgi:hypothetical protein